MRAVGPACAIARLASSRRAHHGEGDVEPLPELLRPGLRREELVDLIAERREEGGRGRTRVFFTVPVAAIGGQRQR